MGFAVARYESGSRSSLTRVRLFDFLGGNDTDVANGVALDSAGNAYITGSTFSTDFPGRERVPGDESREFEHLPWRSSTRRAQHCFTRICRRLGYGLRSRYCAGYADNAYVGGYTGSDEFSRRQPNPGRKATGNDAVLFKLSAAGNQLLFSTYFGRARDDNGYGVAVDSSAMSTSPGFTSSTNLAVTGSAAQAAAGGIGDAFVLKLTTGGSKTYATYLGGNAADTAYAIAADAAGNAYVTGWTNSANFPTTAGAYSTVKKASTDIFVTKINPAGTAFTFSTFVGGNSSDGGYGIDLDTTGVYVAETPSRPISPERPEGRKASRGARTTPLCSSSILAAPACSGPRTWAAPGTTWRAPSRWTAAATFTSLDTRTRALFRP